MHGMKRPGGAAAQAGPGYRAMCSPDDLLAAFIAAEVASSDPAASAMGSLVLKSCELAAESRAQLSLVRHI
jgi:hypothetical protein